jgi:formate-dependent phosphoribosylglycinamide formyltransferase (GAR transformylase)
MAVALASGANIEEATALAVEAAARVRIRYG